MKKFTTPVSMQVAQEQYKRDLKKPLLEMGYKEHNFLNFSSDAKYFVAKQYSNGDMLLIHNQSYDAFTYIETYNPELFLALAAMTEGDEPIVGEYMICIDDA